MVDVNNYKHWDCILKNNTCSDYGAVIFRFCLKEPTIVRVIREHEKHMKVLLERWEIVTRMTSSFFS